MTRLRTVLFWVLAAALVVGHGIVAWHSLVVWRIWEDEAFNLTVPVNLLAGLGYASDGALSGSTITLFDARISTGPTVLLPIAAVLATGADLVIGARLVPLAYWVLLLAGLAVLGRRIGGRWAALLAVAVPLAFTANSGFSPIQGPADILGEIPAAALVVWALIVLPRRAWLAGLLVGLAIQAKLIALLVLPAFAIALWMLADGNGWTRVRNTLRASWLPLVFVALPTFLFELAALFTFGVGGFIEHLRELWRFVRSGGQVAKTSVGEKLVTLADSWSMPGFVAALGAVLLIGLIVAGFVFLRRHRDAVDRQGAEHGAVDPHDVDRWQDPDRLVTTYAAAAAVGALTFVLWWSTASHLPLWVRHPAVGLLAFVPVLAAVAVWAARRMPRGALSRIGVGAAVVLALIVGLGGVLHVTHTFGVQAETLQDQKDAAAPLAAWADENDAEWLAADPWGSAVSMIVLTGAHVGLFDAPAMQDAPRLSQIPCATETLATSGIYQICAAP